MTHVQQEPPEYEPPDDVNPDDVETLTEVIRRRVKETRRVRGLTAAQLAERLAAIGVPHLNRAVLANYENARRTSLTVEELFAIAYALNTTPIELASSGSPWVRVGARVYPSIERDDRLLFADEPWTASRLDIERLLLSLRLQPHFDRRGNIRYFDFTLPDREDNE
jgi:transcriptional regulator with XRE-family HTH domain